MQTAQRGTAQPVPGRCGRKLRGTDPPRYCNRRPLRGRTACRLHGGKSLAGAAHAQFKHGRYSKVMPRQLLDDAQAALRDPEFLSLRENLALVDAQIVDVLRVVESGGPPSQAITAMVEVAKEAEAALAAKDTKRVVTHLNALLAHVSRVGQIRHALDDLARLTEQRRRLVDTETRRVVAGRDTITVESALAVVSALVDIVMRHVTNAQQRHAIISDVRPLLAQPKGRDA